MGNAAVIPPASTTFQGSLEPESRRSPGEFFLGPVLPEVVPPGGPLQRYLLSDLSALIIFLTTFWPLARRAGRKARLALIGWGFLLVHYMALILAAASGSLRGSIPLQLTLHLFALGATDLCVLCFLYAGVSRGQGSRTAPFLIEGALAVLTQASLSVFGFTSPLLYFAAAHLFAVPALHLLARPARRTRSLVLLSLTFLALGFFSAVYSSQHAALVSSSILSILFIAAAIVWANATTPTNHGTRAIALGLTAWGLSFPMAHILRPDGLSAVLLTDLPQFLVAYGMILGLLRDQLGRAEQLALLDPLTGLPNTRHFEDRFAHASAMSTVHRNPIACLVIDVDRFKQINDTLGHPVGDELLKALATRLSWHIGPRDTLARSGGDEFIALLVTDHDEHHLHFIARAMMSAVSVPVSVLGHSIAVTMSIGLAVSTDGGHELPILRKAADDAMYQAKRNGGGQLVIAISEG